MKLWLETPAKTAQKQISVTFLYYCHNKTPALVKAGVLGQMMTYWTGGAA
ncbi:hypothetical protein [Granulibacter bethesdensis]|nr:hypothetical protein [Granulibacter bethesdensis]